MDTIKSIMTTNIYLINAIIVWGYAFIFIGYKRIKRLLPISILSMIMLFVTEIYSMTLKLFTFSNPVLPIMGIPLFHILWAAGSGMVFVHYMPKDFYKKIIVVFIFAILSGIFGYISESLHMHIHSKVYTDIHNFVQDFIVLGFLIWVSEGMFGDRIHEKLI